MQLPHLPQQDPFSGAQTARPSTQNSRGSPRQPKLLARANGQKIVVDSEMRQRLNFPQKKKAAASSSDDEQGEERKVEQPMKKNTANDSSGRRRESIDYLAAFPMARKDVQQLRTTPLRTSASSSSSTALPHDEEHQQQAEGEAEEEFAESPSSAHEHQENDGEHFPAPYHASSTSRYYVYPNSSATTPNNSSPQSTELALIPHGGGGGHDDISSHGGYSNFDNDPTMTATANSGVLLFNRSAPSGPQNSPSMAVASQQQRQYDQHQSSNNKMMLTMSSTSANSAARERTGSGGVMGGSGSRQQQQQLHDLTTDLRPAITSWPASGNRSRAALASNPKVVAGINGIAKPKLMEDIEQRIQNVAARSVYGKKDVMASVLDDLSVIVSSYAPVFSHLQRYIRDCCDAIDVERAQGRQQANEVKQSHEEDLEKFFEGKLKDVLKEKRRIHRERNALEDKLIEEKRRHDVELRKVKQDVYNAVTKVFKDERDLNNMRFLLNSVFKTNQELRENITFLRTGIEPPGRKDGEGEEQDREEGATSTTTTTQQQQEKKKKNGNGAKRGGTSPTAPRQQKTQQQHQSYLREFVKPPPPEFQLGSKREIEQCRLHTQAILIDSASSTHSAAKSLLNKAREENEELRKKISELRETVLRLEGQVHMYRFGGTRTRRDKNNNEDEEEEETEEEARARLTPRPRVDYDIQPSLGVSLQQNTASIVEDLCRSALKISKDVKSTHMSLRRLREASAMVDEHILVARGTVEVWEGPFFPTIQQNDWPTCHHFLRTLVIPEVRNLGWNAAHVSAILYNFFDNFDALRNQAMFFIDDKVCAPPPAVQPWERAKVRPPHDASQSEMLHGGEGAIPIGYIVSLFIKKHFVDLTGSVTAAAVAAGPRESRYASPTNTAAATTVAASANTQGNQGSSGEPKPIISPEEFTTIAYNLWYSVKKYHRQQPLCDLMMNLLDSLLPCEVFKVFNSTIQHVRKQLLECDATKRGLVTHKQCVTTVLNLFADQPTLTWRNMLYSLVQTAAEHRLSLADRMSVKLLTLQEGPSPSSASSSSTQSSANATGSDSDRVASFFTRCIQRHLLSRTRLAYLTFEQVLQPIVIESSVQPSLFVLHIDEARRAMKSHMSSAGDPLIALSVTATGDVREKPAKLDVDKTIDAVLQEIPKLNATVHCPHKWGAAPGSPQRPSETNSNSGYAVASPTDSGPLGRQGSFLGVHRSGGGGRTPLSSNPNSRPPSSLQQQPPAKSKGGTVSSLGNSTTTTTTTRRKKKGLNQTLSSLEHTIAEAFDDHELVEWFSFCQQLRRTLPVFSDRLSEALIDVERVITEQERATEAAFRLKQQQEDEKDEQQAKQQDS